MRYETYRILYIPVNFAFNLSHYVTSWMHHTGKKESKIRGGGGLKKEKKKVTKNLLQGDSNPDPQNQLERKVDATIHCTTSVNADSTSLKKVYIPSLR